MARVMVIIVNYNGERWLGQCLSSLRKTNFPDFRVMVIDNGSTDRSAEIVAGDFREVELLAVGCNLGFCGANNLGIARALTEGCDYVALLNPDTRVEPGWLSELIGVLESEAAYGIAGAVQLRYDDDQLNSWTVRAFPALQEELRHPETARRSIAVEWVEGSCLVIRRSVLEEVGWLDPLYFAFYEEIDLCRRVRAHGYLVALAPRSRIHHHRGGVWEATPETSRERDRRCDRSQFIFALTDPQRSVMTNLTAGLRTVVTKLSDVIRTRSANRLVDLVWIIIDLGLSGRAIHRKWATDRERVRHRRRIGDWE
ncbi:MAG: glycosyltransferase family 2 protein [Acidobacteria bacterium]|nr:glycosyltransferase family 2 protein [Acidobacteriota bacterium]